MRFVNHPPSAGYPSPSGAKQKTPPGAAIKFYLCHENSEHVLSFEIGRRESDFYSGRTDRRTPAVLYSNIDYVLIFNQHSNEDFSN